MFPAWHDDGESAKKDDPANETLLRLVRDAPEGGHDARWFAAANLLLDRRPAGLGRALLDDVRIEVFVLVAELAGIAVDRLPIRRYETHSLTWRGPVALAAAVREIRADYGALTV